MKPYPEYKDSGVPWLGDIPVGWRTRKVKYLFSERLSKGFPEEPLLAATQTKGVVPKSHYENRTVIAQKDLHLLKLVKMNDFVISLRSFQGGIELAHFQGIISPAYTIMVPFNDINVNFFKHFAKSKPFIKLLTTCVTGIREGQNIDYAVLKRNKIPLPFLNDQAQISRFLDWKTSQIAKFIRNKKRLIDLLKEHKQVIINDAVTGKIDVTTGKPYPKYKDSGVEWLGQVPEDWEVVRIKSLSIVKRGASPRPIDDKKYFDIRGEYAWVRIADVSASEKYLYRTTQKLSQLGISLSVKIEPDDIFLSIAGSVGKPIISKIKCCIHDGFVYFPQFKGNCDFLYYLFISKKLFEGLGKLGTQLNLNTATIGSILIPWPNSSKQEKISNYIINKIEFIDQAISRNEREISLIQEYRDRLIADVVTGKIDVRDIEVPELSEETSVDVIDEDALDSDEDIQKTGEE